MGIWTLANPVFWNSALNIMAFPNPPIPSNANFSWLNRFHGAAKRLTPGESDTISATTTHNGTIFEIKEHALAPKNIVTGFEEWQEEGGYSINTLVYVTSEKTWIDDAGTSFYQMPGVYICVSPVPPKIDIANFDNAFLKTYYSNNTQHPGIVYAPVVVINDTRLLAYQTEDGKGKYWYCIAPAISADISCQDGMGVTTYAAMQKSGSV